MMEFVGIGGQTSGVAIGIANALRIIADNFGVTASAGVILSSIIASRLIGRSIKPLIARLKDAGVAVSTLFTALRATSSLGGVLTAIASTGGLTTLAGLVGGGGSPKFWTFHRKI